MSSKLTWREFSSMFSSFDKTTLMKGPAGGALGLRAGLAPGTSCLRSLGAAWLAPNRGPAGCRSDPATEGAPQRVPMQPGTQNKSPPARESRHTRMGAASFTPRAAWILGKLSQPLTKAGGQVISFWKLKPTSLSCCWLSGDWQTRRHGAPHHRRTRTGVLCVCMF